MIRRALLLAVLAALCGPVGAAWGGTITAPAGSGFAYQRWSDEARVPTVSVTVAEEQGPCAVALGCASESVIYLPSAGWIDPATARHVFLHELGHVFDDQVMSETDRATFESIVGQSSAWVWADDSPQSPQEVFAETYAYCALRPINRIIGSPSVGVIIDRERARAACRWLRTL